MAFYGPPEEGLMFFSQQSGTEVLRMFERYPTRDWAGEFAASPAHAQWVLGSLRHVKARPGEADVPTQHHLPQPGSGRHRRS